MRRSAWPIFVFLLIIQLVFSAALFSNESFLIGEERAGAPVLLNQFYEERGGALAWFKDGAPVPAVRDLLNAIRQADREGLVPSEYHLAAITDLLDAYDWVNEPPASEAAKQLDMLLTDAFLSYGSDLVSGRTNPYDVDDDWFAGRRTGDLPLTLENALESGHVRQALNSLLPTNPVYQRLRAALARYRQMQKNRGWPHVSAGPAIKKGDRDPRLITLRRRLHLEGFLNQRPSRKPVFDLALERALKRFQVQHGLEPDGVLGKDTVNALNVSVEDRVRQIQLNMERCRWLPDNLGVRYIFVNVPSFTLQLIEDGRETMSMRVVVGRKMRQTPVFSSTMTHIVFNPPWSVPHNVAKLDILDHIREEPDYLTSHNFEVYEDHGVKAKIIEPALVDWTTVTPENLKFRFRQKPGPLNALGRVKFLLPNRFDVYLHDTPSRSLFSKNVRDFSSGCIRLEKPVELATHLLQGDARWTPEKIEDAIAKGTEQIVPLPEKLPVHLMYWTAWVDEQDNVQFRDDIYGRDAALAEALNPEPAL